MKTIKAYLINQKEIASAMYVTLIKEGGNLIDQNFWSARIIHIDLMLRQLEDGKEKTNKKK